MKGSPSIEILMSCPSLFTRIFHVQSAIRQFQNIFKGPVLQMNRLIALPAMLKYLTGILPVVTGRLTTIRLKMLHIVQTVMVPMQPNQGMMTHHLSTERPYPVSVVIATARMGKHPCPQN